MIDEKNANDQFRITRVWAKNFRSIRELDLELGPLTVLVGPNASGKSNVMDVLRFIRDCTVSGLDRAISIRTGISEIRRRSAKRTTPNIAVGLEASLGGFELAYGFTIARRRDGGSKIIGEKVQLKDMSTGKVDQLEVRDGKFITPKLDAVPDSFDSSHLLLTNLIFRSVLFEYLGTEVSNEDNTGGADANRSSLFSQISRMRFYALYPHELRQPQVPGDTNGLDDRGRNLATIFRQLKRSRHREMDEIKAAINYVVPDISDIDVKDIGGYLWLKFLHKGVGGNGSGSWFNVTQESDGTLRLFGILVALYQHTPPSFIGIEEPELNVHPGALGVLADVIQEASGRSQIMVTTHSPDLIDLLPVEAIRAVELVDGETRVGEVSERQTRAIKDRLFTPGELHSMEGLEVQTPVAE